MVEKKIRWTISSQLGATLLVEAREIELSGWIDLFKFYSGAISIVQVTPTVAATWGTDTQMRGHDILRIDVSPLEICFTFWLRNRCTSVPSQLNGNEAAKKFSSNWCVQVGELIKFPFWTEWYDITNGNGLYKDCMHIAWIRDLDSWSTPPG